MLTEDKIMQNLWNNLKNGRIRPEMLRGKAFNAISPIF